MVPLDYSSLLYFRRLPCNGGFCSISHLFLDSKTTHAYFPESSVPIHWEYSNEIASVRHRTSKWSTRARRRAFSCSEIEISLRQVTPERSLLFSIPNQPLESYGHVLVRWTVPGVLEVPRFCICSAASDENRVRWGSEPNRIEMLQAAQTLEPARFDVVGFHTADHRLVGAFEFTGQRVGEFYEGHCFVLQKDRKLKIGDELWGWYTGIIGETQIQSKRLLAVVHEIPGVPVPKLEPPEQSND